MKPRGVEGGISPADPVTLAYHRQMINTRAALHFKAPASAIMSSAFSYSDRGESKARITARHHRLISRSKSRPKSQDIEHAG